eukprot:TRINITY_DN2_c7_g1_i1.p2 TRINITY_DN2_c7_g1~~TRINITY_DN2_c7_g1_i1.p2  ORF type:complete len:60 (-),score=1.70 TRINITY_DN2_c7_g1_i1:21-200(-)
MCMCMCMCVYAYVCVLCVYVWESVRWREAITTHPPHSHHHTVNRDKVTLHEIKANGPLV